MSSNVTLDSGQMDSPLFALSSPSQASGASSPGADRVFFGPLRSPEKKFATRAGSAPFRTPVRRSARLSSAMVPPPLFPQQQAAALASIASTSREGTPDEDGVVDEPSVVLASRVLSASGNPSPPPTPPLPAQTESDAFMDVQLLDVTQTPLPPDVTTVPPNGPLIPIEDIPEPVVEPPATTARTPTPVVVEPAIRNSPQPDLITFDSFVANDNDDDTTTDAPSRNVLHAQPSTATVDDLLSMSPHPPPSVPSDPLARSPPHEGDERDHATTPDEEMEVANSLIIEVDTPNDAAPNAEPGQSHHADTTDAAAEEAHPPPRRSSRPRRSRNSLPQTVATPQPAHPITQGPQEDAKDQSEADIPGAPQPSPVRKRKLKAYPQLQDTQVESRDANTPRKPAQAASVRRELGSLSPLSTAVLSQLLPKPSGNSASRSTTPQPEEPPQAGPSEVVAPLAPSTPPRQITNLVFPRVGTQVDGTASESQRPKSPLRLFATSPLKLDDAVRTPARRVPIAQAIAEGTYSTQKLPALFSAPRPAAPGSPVFKRLAPDDPMRSPARRVPMNEAMLTMPMSPDKGKSVFRPTSPVRGAARERQRSGSAEPRPPFPARKERGASAEPTTRPPALGRRPVFQKPASSEGLASGSGLVKPKTALPFPLAQAQRLHPSIPEADEPGPSVARPSTANASAGAGKSSIASPAKAPSSLRQPSAGAGSKIPRIGAKPYARPKGVGKAETGSGLLAQKGATGKPLRIVAVGSSSSGCSSDEGHGVPRPAAKPPRPPAAAATTTEAPSAPNFKRKRDAEPPKPAPTPAVQPVIVIRKVVPGMFNKGEKAPASGAGPAEQTQSKDLAPAPSPAKPAGPIRGRSAVHWKRPGQPTAPSPSPMPPPQEAVQAKAPSPAPEQAPAPPAGPAGPAVQAEAPRLSPVKEPRQTTPPAAEAAVVAGPSESSSDALAAGPSAAPEPTEEKPGRHRRSSRSKRTQDRAPTTDVFGTVAPATSANTNAPGPSTSKAPSTRTGHTRRRPIPLSSELAGPFAGMSAVALKALTNANTLKNQQQLAVLTTEVIRKEGARPDSPTTKVRSALERQREERVLQRQERAERRARRSGGEEMAEAAAPGAEGSSAAGVGEAEGDAGDASFMSVDRDPEGVPLRHRRGPGDEEDYETPPRPERPAKRARFDGFDGGGEKEEREVPEKRVKWDKGLHTTVYLDDSPPKPRRNKHAVPTQKGCLTPAAKALRLDTLGNVLNAELPVGGLVRESIVVKKFVFDDDEVEPEPASPAPAKSTRSKSKKAKSSSSSSSSS
ncbi:hypothetical protein C8Q77DRAFT_1207168 [Trametes polyzona]|nr:hypothetical protein C8Q77DRAFT_1207168 [Trametes polyzona]